MTNEEKIKELVNGYGRCCLEECKSITLKMAEWKDEQFTAEKQALIDKACNEFSNFLEEMKEIWWKGDGCDESVKFHWLISFRKVMEETK